MKYLILMFCLVGVNTFVFAEKKIETPIAITVYPFCSLQGVCKLSITMKNLSNYKVEMFSSTFINNQPNYQGVGALTQEEYIKKNARKDFKNLKQKPTIKSKFKGYLTDSNRITFKPLEEKGFNLDKLHDVYEFESDKRYMLNFYLSFVHFYIDGEYVLTTYIGTDHAGYLSMPSEVLKPEIRLE